MNTVMDDNRILTLANNDRIPMLRPNVTLHFEVEDLRNASPATVSRAGIIYISEADLGYSPMVTSWIKGRPKDGAQIQVHPRHPHTHQIIRNTSSTRSTCGYPLACFTLVLRCIWISTYSSCSTSSRRSAAPK